MSEDEGRVSPPFWRHNSINRLVCSDSASYLVEYVGLAPVYHLVINSGEAG